ncbi:MAG: FAD-dependent oxidoreductase [Candidatus Pacebacteria bacterium]|nr:FAD-dependent oxidoreductase [Candidatus Paceibacterota bacterium]
MPDKKTKYPLIIIGTGPAGLMASVYASRYKIEHLMIGEFLGGLILGAHKIGNFPSEKEISGIDLITKMKEQAESLGTSMLHNKVVDITKENQEFKITIQNGEEFWAKAVLLANGTENRKLNLPNEDNFLGKGVSYCATCDAAFFHDKTVAVIGGGDSANMASLYLSEVAKKVYQIYRKDELRGELMRIEKIKNNEKIEIIYNTEVTALVGGEKLEKIVLNKDYNGESELVVEGMFVEIGTIPQGELAESLSVEVDENKYIKVGADQKTNQEGVWAAGDITTGSNNFHQVITACSEGAIAAESIFKFLQNK